jgi:hypothetical protein
LEFRHTHKRLLTFWKQLQKIHLIQVHKSQTAYSLDNIFFRALKAKLPILEWRSQFKIVLETTKGLAYLHDVRGQRIIHCDINSSSMLQLQGVILTLTLPFFAHTLSFYS